MTRPLSVFDGLAAYVFSHRATGFVGNLTVPKTINSAPPWPLAETLIVNLQLLGLVAVQQSLSARPAFKRGWT